ncbi:MAG TPA: cellulase family glycosylhydrolase, partial [Candidatus Goldiibacteriota bacterium]|nr:cellulase family glycosylhydrolase [Candidatus Goldiibacteriota bacterium]
FRIRFTPPKRGKWTYSVSVNGKKGVMFLAPPKAITVLPARGKKGIVRVSREDPLYFEHESRDPFFALGANIAWYKDDFEAEYDSYFSKFADSGANTARIWMAPWSFSIEWDGPIGDYSARQKQAHMLDRVFEMAEKHGVYIMLCLVSHGEFSEKTNPEWGRNPYNAANDGLLNKPSEFFTDPVAARAFENRLRYIIARWSYSENLLSWELFNEADLTDDYDPEDSAAWHAAMARFIKKHDAHRHMVTTSFSNPDMDPAVWKIPEIDFTQTHLYGLYDEAVSVYEASSQKIEAYKKPHLAGEFGISADPGDRGMQDDRDGVCLQNSLWAGAFSLSAGAPLSWYWDSYIEANNLYYRFRPLADFIKGIKWPAENLTVAGSRQVYYRSGEGRPGGNVSIFPREIWKKSPKNIFSVKPDGAVINKESFYGFIFGSAKPEMKNDPVIAVKNVSPVTLVIKVKRVSDDNSLDVRVNGTLVMSEKMSAAAEKTAKYLPEWGIYQADTDREYRVQIAPGDNEITISNGGNDWFLIGSVVIEGLLDPRLSGVFVSGIQGTEGAYLWLKAPDYGWKKGSGSPVRGAYIEIPGLNPGRYIVSFYETDTGSILSGFESIIENEMALTLDLPEFSRDLAIKVKKFAKPESKVKSKMPVKPVKSKTKK